MAVEPTWIRIHVPYVNNLWSNIAMWVSDNMDRDDINFNFPERVFAFKNTEEAFLFSLKFNGTTIK